MLLTRIHVVLTTHRLVCLQICLALIQISYLWSRSIGVIQTHMSMKSANSICSCFLGRNSFIIFLLYILWLRIQKILHLFLLNSLFSCLFPSVLDRILSIFVKHFIFRNYIFHWRSNSQLLFMIMLLRIFKNSIILDLCNTHSAWKVWDNCFFSLKIVDRVR